MIVEIIRNDKLKYIWPILRVWLGFQWLISGIKKITDPNGVWVGENAGQAMRSFWIQIVGAQGGGNVSGASPQGAEGAAQALSPFPWYRSFIQFLLDGHNEVWFSYFIVASEVMIGAALILGLLTTLVALGGAFMNLNFMLAGTVSTNPILYTAAILLIMAGRNAGFIGLDTFVIPRIEDKLKISLYKD